MSAILDLIVDAFRFIWRCVKDLVCALLLLIAAVLAPWRVPTLCDGEISTETHDAFHDTAATAFVRAIGDVLTLAVGAVVVCSWRMPQLCRSLAATSDRGSGYCPERRKVVWLAFAAVFADLPFVLLLALGHLAFWRIPVFWYRVMKNDAPWPLCGNSVQDAPCDVSDFRTAIAWNAWMALVDIICALPALLLLLTVYRAPLTVRFLLLDSKTEGSKKLFVLLQFFLVLLDLPFAVLFVLQHFALWRIPLLWRRVYTTFVEGEEPCDDFCDPASNKKTATDVRVFVLKNLAGAVTDVLCLFPALLLLVSLYRVPLVVRTLCRSTANEWKQKLFLVMQAGLVLADAPLLVPLFLCCVFFWRGLLVIRCMRTYMAERDDNGNERHLCSFGDTEPGDDLYTAESTYLRIRIVKNGFLGFVDILGLMLLLLHVFVLHRLPLTVTYILKSDGTGADKRKFFVTNFAQGLLDIPVACVLLLSTVFGFWRIPVIFGGLAELFQRHGKHAFCVYEPHTTPSDAAGETLECTTEACRQTRAHVGACAVMVLTDILTLLPLTLVVLTVYRLPRTARALCNSDTDHFAKKLFVLEQCLYVVLDLPFVLLGAVCHIFFWRAPLLWHDVCRVAAEDADDDGSSAAEQLDGSAMGASAEPAATPAAAQQQEAQGPRIRRLCAYHAGMVFVDIVCVPLFLVTLLSMYRLPQTIVFFMRSEATDARKRARLALQVLMLLIDLPCALFWLVAHLAFWRIPAMYREVAAIVDEHGGAGELCCGLPADGEELSSLSHGVSDKLRRQTCAALLRSVTDLLLLLPLALLVLSMYRLPTVVRAFRSDALSPRGLKLFLLMQFGLLFLDLPFGFLALLSCLTVYRGVLLIRDAVREAKEIGAYLCTPDPFADDDAALFCFLPLHNPYRRLIAYHAGSIVTDVLCVLPALLVCVTGYRVKCTHADVTADGQTTHQRKGVIVLAALNVLLDIPFILVGAIALCSGLRTPAMWGVLTHPDATESTRRQGAAWQFVFLIRDLLCLVPCVVFIIMPHRIVHAARTLLALLRRAPDGPELLPVFRCAVSFAHDERVGIDTVFTRFEDEHAEPTAETPLAPLPPPGTPVTAYVQDLADYGTTFWEAIQVRFGAVQRYSLEHRVALGAVLRGRVVAHADGQLLAIRWDIPEPPKVLRSLALQLSTCADAPLRIECIVNGKPQVLTRCRFVWSQALVAAGDPSNDNTGVVVPSTYADHAPVASDVLFRVAIMQFLLACADVLSLLALVLTHLLPYRAWRIYDCALEPRARAYLRDGYDSVSWATELMDSASSLFHRTMADMDAQLLRLTQEHSSPHSNRELELFANNCGKGWEGIASESLSNFHDDMTIAASYELCVTIGDDAEHRVEAACDAVTSAMHGLFAAFAYRARRLVHTVAAPQNPESAEDHQPGAASDRVSLIALASAVEDARAPAASDVAALRAEISREFSAVARFDAITGWDYVPYHAVAGQFGLFILDVLALIAFLIVCATGYRTFSVVRDVTKAATGTARRTLCLEHLLQLPVDLLYLLKFLLVLLTIRGIAAMPSHLLISMLTDPSFATLRRVIDHHIAVAGATLKHAAGFILSCDTVKFIVATVCFGLLAPCVTLEGAFREILTAPAPDSERHSPTSDRKEEEPPREPKKCALALTVLFALFWVIAVPCIAAYAIGRDVNAANAAIVYYAFMGAVCLLGVVAAVWTRHPTCVSLLRDEIMHVKPTVQNISAYAAIVLEGAFLAAACIGAITITALPEAGVAPHSGERLLDTSRYLFMVFGQDWAAAHLPFGTYFTIVLVFVHFVLAAMPVVVGRMLEWEDPKRITHNRTWMTAMLVLGQYALLLVARNVAVMLACDPTTGRMAASPAVECWSGTHIHLATLLMVIFTVYLPSALVRNVSFEERHCGWIDVAYPELYKMLVNNAATIAVTASALLWRFPRAAIAIVGVCALWNAVWTALYSRVFNSDEGLVCSVRALGVYRLAMYVGVLLTSIVAMIAQVAQPGGVVPYVLLFVPMLLAWIVSVGYSLWLERQWPADNGLEAAKNQLLDVELALCDAGAMHSSWAPVRNVWVGIVRAATRASVVTRSALDVQRAASSLAFSEVFAAARHRWVTDALAAVEDCDVGQGVHLAPPTGRDAANPSFGWQCCPDDGAAAAYVETIAADHVGRSERDAVAEALRVVTTLNNALLVNKPEASFSLEPPMNVHSVSIS